jgi:hypothetical protein
MRSPAGGLEAVVEHDIQERSIDLNFAVVPDEAQFPELVHEIIDACACCNDHLRQHFLRYFGEYAVGPVLLPVAGKQESFTPPSCKYSTLLAASPCE